MPTPSRKRSPNAPRSSACPAATSAGSWRQTLRIPVATVSVVVASRHGRALRERRAAAEPERPVSERLDLARRVPFPPGGGARFRTCPSGMDERLARRRPLPGVARQIACRTLGPRVRLTLVLVAAAASRRRPPPRTRPSRRTAASTRRTCSARRRASGSSCSTRSGRVVAARRAPTASAARSSASCRPGGGYRVRHGAQDAAGRFRVLRPGAQPASAPSTSARSSSRASTT